MYVGVSQPSAAQLEYWEARLKEYGLTMDRGRSNFLDYGHEVKDLDTDGRRLYPRPELAPDASDEGVEWPRSLA